MPFPDFPKSGEEISMAAEAANDATKPAAIPGQNQNRHPVGLWFFFWGEFAERCSYYGMRAILFLYMTQVIRYSTTDATPLYSAFKMACYFLPLLGGWIADRWLGRYWTIVGFSVPYVMGHFILGIPTHIALFMALALLAGGSGVIKPNISTLMGQTYDQQRPGQERLRSAAFLWFYFAINVGALISQLALPEIRQRYILSHISPELREQVEPMLLSGEDITRVVPADVLADAYALAFQFPAWLMVVSLAIFAAGKKFYALEKIEHHPVSPQERRLQRQTVWRLFGIFALVVLFWTGYEHNDTLWIAFTRDYVDLRVPGLSKPIAPDQLQFLNALFVIILVPTFNFVFARLDPQVKIFTAMRKVMAGFVLTAAAIGIMAIAGYLAQGHTHQVMQGEKLAEVSTTKVSVIWPAMAYIVLTFGEVLLYGTMLELAYAAAPKSMKGFITACFLLTNTLGNFVNVGWTPMYGGSLTDAVSDRGPLLPGPFFAITAAMVVAAAIIFKFVGKRFEHAQKEQAQAAEVEEWKPAYRTLPSGAKEDHIRSGKKPPPEDPSDQGIKEI
jgi:POT family proton-dependent oligopeptide transporter